MIIVTGGAGFIGSAFVAKLNAQGINDIIIVDDPNSNARAQNLAHKKFSQYISKSDFIESVKKSSVPSGVRAIVHMGACSSTTERDLEYLRANNFATYGDGAQGYGDDVANLESLKPLNPYGDSKHRMDLWAKDHDLLSKIVGLKFFNVYGPNEYYKGSMASIAWKAFNTINQTGSFSLFKSHKPEYKDGEQMRDFVYVKDCCEIMYWFLKNPSVNGLFNVGSGKARSWNDLLNAVFHAMGKPPSITYIDMPTELRNQYQYFTEAPIDKLRKAGYSLPLSTLEEGVTDYVRNHLLKADQHW